MKLVRSDLGRFNSTEQIGLGYSFRVGTVTVIAATNVCVPFRWMLHLRQPDKAARKTLREPRRPGVFL